GAGLDVGARLDPGGARRERRSFRALQQKHHRRSRAAVTVLRAQLAPGPPPVPQAGAGRRAGVRGPEDDPRGVGPGAGLAVPAHHRRRPGARLRGLVVEGARRDGLPAGRAPGLIADTGPPTARRASVMTVAPGSVAGIVPAAPCPAPSPRGSASPSSRASGPSGAPPKAASSPSPTRSRSPTWVTRR